jgi:hypothetical protein
MVDIVSQHSGRTSKATAVSRRYMKCPKSLNSIDRQGFIPVAANHPRDEVSLCPPGGTYYICNNACALMTAFIKHCRSGTLKRDDP